MLRVWLILVAAVLFAHPLPASAYVDGGPMETTKKVLESSNLSLIHI